MFMSLSSPLFRFYVCVRVLVRHAAITAEFAKTLPSATVDTLERVENGYVHEAFELQASIQKKTIGADYDASGMRQLLFHGTDAVEAIVNATDGYSFLPLLAGSKTGAIWGDGTYFARDARYSDSHARILPNGQKQMLVVEVLLGRWAQGKRGMAKCPLLPGEQYKKYHSLANDVANPSIFVVQHSTQAYPAYLITYHV